MLVSVTKLSNIQISPDWTHCLSALVSLLLWVRVPHQFSFNNGNVPVTVACFGGWVELLSDHNHLTSVIEFLHEIPGLKSGHSGDVHVIDEQNLVSNLQNPVLISCTS